MTVPEPRVAVIIPCYDDGATLLDVVRSAVDQPEPVDLVVVDDGSTDAETRSVVDRLAAQGHHIVRQANAGLAAARMAGVRATTAPYVLPLDADDLLERGVVPLLADILDRSPEVAAVWGNYQRFGDESTLQPTARSLDPWQLAYQNDLPSTALIRRSALLDVGGWQPRGGYEDWDLWLSLAAAGRKGVGIDAVVYRYRRAGTRMLHTAAARHEDVYDVLRAAHPSVFEQRRRNWLRSPAPLMLRLALPAIEVLPLSRHHKRLAGGVATHLAHRRGIRLLLRRIREQGAGTGPGAPAPPG